MAVGDPNQWNHSRRHSCFCENVRSGCEHIHRDHYDFGYRSCLANGQRYVGRHHADAHCQPHFAEFRVSDWNHAALAAASEHHRHLRFDVHRYCLGRRVAFSDALVGNHRNFRKRLCEHVRADCEHLQRDRYDQGPLAPPRNS